MTLFRQIAFLILLMFAIISYGLKTNKIQNASFDCAKYFISINPDWKFAYDDIKFSESALVLESKDSVWAILFPGSLTLQNDTISVNQEAGFPIKCLRIGRAKIEENIKIDFLNNERIFKRINDTLLEFDNKQYIKTDKIVLSGCNCEWYNK